MNGKHEPPLLEVENLVTVFDTERGPLRAVDEVSFTLAQGETVGIVGESGCGKSVTALSILRLLPSRVARIIQGRIRLRGQDLLPLDPEEMRKIRGNQISMIFQDPMTSLNPVFRVGDQIQEAIILHQNVDKKEARERTLTSMKQVGIPDYHQRIDDYPHQFSGGQRQRIMIAMALACQPALLIADEPTTALDVTIQAQILDLIRSLRKEMNMAVLLITHDLGVVAEMVDRVLLMYAGRIVESAPVEEFFRNPCHPYAHGLLKSLPKFSFESGQEGRREFLPTIPGMVPDLRCLPSGCRFSDRCESVQERCRLEEPVSEQVSPDHDVHCWEWKNL